MKMPLNVFQARYNLLECHIAWIHNIACIVSYPVASFWKYSQLIEISSTKVLKRKFKAAMSLEANPTRTRRQNRCVICHQVRQTHLTCPQNRDGAQLQDIGAQQRAGKNSSKSILMISTWNMILLIIWKREMVKRMSLVIATSILRILFYRFMQPFLRRTYTQISMRVHLGGSKSINS